MKKILAFLLALCMILALCACGDTTAPVEEGKTADAASTAADAAAAVEGVVEETAQSHYNFYDIIKIEHDYFRFEAAGMASTIKELSQKYGFTYDFHYITCDNDPELAMTSLENAIADNADFIFVCIPDQAMSAAFLERCEEAGVPVCAVDDGLIDEDENLIAPWRGIDAYNIGYACGEWLANYIKDNNLVDDPSVGLIYMTTDTVSSITPRTDGEIQAMADILGADALADRTWRADYLNTSDLAYDAAAAVITAHPEISTWLVNTPSETGVEGAVAFLEEQGLADDAVVVCCGADTAVQQWADGNWGCVKMAFYFSGIVIGQTAAADAVEYLVNGTEMVPKFACPAIPIDITNYGEKYLSADTLDYEPF